MLRTSVALRQGCRVFGRPQQASPVTVLKSSNHAIRISSSTTTTVTSSANAITKIGFGSLAGIRSNVLADFTRAAGIGVAAGLVTSLAGVGGALVMIPALTAAPLKLAQHAAHGTALSAVAATGLSGAWSYREHLSVEEDALPTALIALTGMMGARFGARHSIQFSTKALKRALGSFMLVLAALVPCKESILDNIMEQNEGNSKHDLLHSLNLHEDSYIMQLWEYMHQVVPPAAVGSASGYLSGLFGVGGGILVIPALTIFTEPSSHYQVLATSLLATSLPALMGTLTHARLGNVAWRIAPALCVGATLGASIGGRLGQQTDEKTLQTGFTGLLILLGTKTLLRM